MNPKNLLDKSVKKQRFFGTSVFQLLFGAVDPEENVADFAVPTANGITTNENVRDLYRGEYLMISRANQVLATIDDVDFDADAKNNLKGQVLLVTDIVKTMHFSAFSFQLLKKLHLLLWIFREQMGIQFPGLLLT